MKLQTFIVCDDIRNEIGQKHSLIGVYDDRILFNVTPDKKNTWPKQMKLGIFAKISFEELTPKSFSFKMKYNENDVLLGEGSVNIKESEKNMNKFIVAIVNNNFLFDKPGKIKFTFIFFDKSKNNIGSVSPDFELEVEELVVG
ncbi:MAG: hypothetical protein HQ557_19790 [Bacteroidetes bacterium]|nr:hypothetical protein [Bacteroidota bacterium]